MLYSGCEGYKHTVRNNVKNFIEKLLPKIMLQEKEQQLKDLIFFSF